MAVDTRDKRASVLGLVLGAALVLPNPDGAALDVGDRQQTAYCYRGISAGAAETAIVLPTNTASYQGVMTAATASYQSTMTTATASYSAALPTSTAEWGQ